MIRTAITRGTIILTYEAYRKKLKRNTIRFAAAFIALFAVMTVYFVYGAVANRVELFSNDYNHRDQLLEKRNLRGTIYAGDGETVLAYSEAYTDEDGSVKQRRIYPYAEIYAHAVGYAPLGGSGIESYSKYDLLHSDIPLSEKVERDSMEDGEDRLYPGNNVITTLDPSLQEAAYEAMEGYEGAVIVTEVSTGRILAMVSKPDFDPGQIEELWDSLMEDTESGTLLNRVTQGMYPPGSTFKIVDTIALLEGNPEAAEDYEFDCSGVFEYEDKSIHCYEYEVHGEVDLAESFAHSCNSSFANIGVNLLDRKALARTLNKLYFGKKLPYDLPCAVSSAGNVGEMAEADIMQLAIGQGTTGMSPLHVHMITSAVASRGNLMKPYLISELQDADGRELRRYETKDCGSIFSEQTASSIRDMMRLAVTEGTAVGLSGRSYDPCGKTGSAEFDNNKSSHAWFTGFAPFDNPEICITVLIEGKGMASSYAVPVAGQIMDVWFGE